MIWWLPSNFRICTGSEILIVIHHESRDMAGNRRSVHFVLGRIVSANPTAEWGYWRNTRFSLKFH